METELCESIPVAFGHKWKIFGFRRLVEFFA